MYRALGDDKAEAGMVTTIFPFRIRAEVPEEVGMDTADSSGLKREAGRACEEEWKGWCR